MRRGITLIEALVVMGIIGVLTAITVPAVMWSREASRRMECQNRLKQIGVAIATFESDHGTLPRGASMRYDLLPYIGLTALHEQVDRSATTPFDYWRPVENVVIPLYLCPSDGVVVPGNDAWASSNYQACFGTGVLADGWNGMFRRNVESEPTDFVENVRSADVTDGLSNTVAMSELLRASGTTSERLRTIWNLPQYRTLPSQSDELARACDQIPPHPVQYGYGGNPFRLGTPWRTGDCGAGMYNHMLTPNRPSCYNGTHVATGVYTAASLHAGGVNTLWGDGRVQFTSQGIDSLVWRQMGSRAENIGGGL